MMWIAFAVGLILGVSVGILILGLLRSASIYSEQWVSRPVPVGEESRLQPAFDSKPGRSPA